MMTGEKKSCPIRSANIEKNCVQDKCAFWQAGPNAPGDSGYVGDCAFYKFHEMNSTIKQLALELKRRK